MLLRIWSDELDLGSDKRETAASKNRLSPLEAGRSLFPPANGVYIIGLHTVYSGYYSQAALVVKNMPAKARRRKELRFNPWVRKIPWRRAWQPAPVFLPGESRGLRSLVGSSP